jgi:integrase
MHAVLYDAAGHSRLPVTMPGFHEGRAPRNKGRRYPADPPTVEEIIAVMRAAGAGADGARLRALIVILWRAGLRIGEALGLAETDLDVSRGAVLVCRGKGGRCREVGMDRWAWSQLEPWMSVRRRLPVGALLCVIRARSLVVTGSHRRRASNWRAPRSGRRCGDASLPINSVTRTRSRWRMRACPWSLSSASSATPTSASRRSICRGSTAQRSSTPSTGDRPP